MPTYTVQARPMSTVAPRGARWGGVVAAAVWNALVSVGHHRARRDVLAAARAMDAKSPRMAQELREDLRFGDRLAGRDHD